MLWRKKRENNVEIIVAKSGGFCHGVKKAVDTAMKINPENAYIFGEIIHNPEVVERLQSRGLTTVERLDEVPDGATLIIRSHGVQKRVYDLCAARNIQVVDCTCQFVRKTQKIVEAESAKGNTVVIIGEPPNPAIQ